MQQTHRDPGYFLGRVILYALFTALLFLGLEAVLRSLPNEYSLKAGYLDDQGSKIDVLVLGSSHAYYGIDPAFLSGNGFNAANVSQSLNYDLLILKKYEADLTELDAIILPISYFTLFHNIEEGTEAWRIRNYHLYYGLTVPEGITGLTEVIGNPGYTNFLKLTTYLEKGTLVSCAENGFLGRPVDDPQDLSKTGQRAAQRHAGISEENFAANRKILEAIIATAERRGAHLVLYTPPATAMYTDHLDAEQLRRTTSSARELDETYEAVVYLDFLKDPRFTPDDFYDGDHLNARGAEKFTRILDDILRSFQSEGLETDAFIQTRPKAG